MQDEKTRNYDRDTLRIFWHAALQHKTLFVKSFLFTAGSTIFNVVTPLFIGKTLADLAHPGGHPEHYLLYFAVAALAGLIANRIGFRAMLVHNAHVMSDLQKLGMQTLLKRSVGFHNNNVGGKLVSDAIDYPTSYAQLASAAFANLFPFAITLIVGTTLILTESWLIGLIVLAMVVLTIGSGVVESRYRRPVRARRLKAGKKVTAHLADTITNVQAVKTFAREEQELTTHTRLGEALRNLRVKDWRTAANNGNARVAALVLFQVIFVLAIIHVVHQDPSLLGVGIFVFSFTIMLSNRMFEVNVMMRNIEDGFLQASPLTEIIMGEPEIKDRKDAGKLKTTNGAIDFNDVTFHYEDATNSQTVFSGLDLHIKPGEKVGLVGPSGGGKSTFTRLLLRFEDINDGTITVDDQNIADVTQVSLREAVSYVPQEPLLFHRTIAENIAYGNAKATQKDILAASKAAHAADFIDQLPDQYDTIVGERGVKLSGGQRQRIAIARAILKDAPILVLDEATSALDSESEVYIQEALWKLMENRTAIVIAHRLSTIQKMDRIVVLEDGKITEQGTHKQLLESKGTYARLWAHQSGGFIED
ncbi:MAG TPA: ABC transporter ATP-binding protein [Bacillota bacterium]|nr:ABC transporter ATP-binding protein [Bacillota bacterium]